MSVSSTLGRSFASSRFWFSLIVLASQGHSAALVWVAALAATACGPSATLSSMGICSRLCTSAVSSGAIPLPPC
eukprot:1659021-Pyramimonas_sp.AAC.1